MNNLLIDGNHLAHRCRHTFKLSNNGVDVSVTYGFLRVLSSLLNKWEVGSLTVCFDGGIPEFRRVAVPSYKANRHKDDDPIEYAEFLRQIIELETYALPMMGAVVVRRQGVEADDLLYHASRLYAGDSIIVTGDMDLLQAANNRVAVYNPGKERYYTVKQIEIEIGLPFNSLLDWRALQGDSSDNIPGIQGVGEKTATKLLKMFGDVSGVYNAATGANPKGELQPKLAEAIKEFGWNKIVNNIYVSALYADRVGAKAAVLNSIKYYHSYSKDRVKKYLWRNAFVSLMDSQFMGQLSKLRIPIYNLKGVRVPCVAPVRQAYE